MYYLFGIVIISTILLSHHPLLVVITAAISSFLPTFMACIDMHLNFRISIRFHGGREVDLYLYLAQAYFDSGQHSECGQALLKSLHIFPGRLQLW